MAGLLKFGLKPVQNRLNKSGLSPYKQDEDAGVVQKTEVVAGKSTVLSFNKI